VPEWTKKGGCKKVRLTGGKPLEGRTVRGPHLVNPQAVRKTIHFKKSGTGTVRWNPGDFYNRIPGK